LLKNFKSEQIIRTAIIVQLGIAIIFFTGAINGWYGLAATIAMIFLILSCIGFIYPNATALSMAPFEKNAGIASALMGTMQLGLGAAASFFIGILSSRSATPMAAIMAVSSAIALIVLLSGRKKIDPVHV
jgi:MFS transporter, DHA1 family, multidrug resistance protein